MWENVNAGIHTPFLFSTHNHAVSEYRITRHCFCQGTKTSIFHSAPPKDTPITVSELAKHDGSDASLPIYVAIKGDIFDVSANKDAYGPGAGYNVFTGKDASKASMVW